MSSGEAEVSHPIAPQSLPARPNPWRLFWAYNSPGPRWPGATRAALAIGIPGFIAYLLGFEQEMLLVAAGSCAVIYGEGHPYRARISIIAIAGSLLTAGSLGGAFVGQLMWANIGDGGSHWWMLLSAIWATALATSLAYCANALRLPPPGPFFIVMVSGAATMTAHIGISPLHVGLWALCGAASAMVCGMAPMLINPRGPEEAAVNTLLRAVQSFKETGGHSVSKRHQAETALAECWNALADARVILGGRVIDPHREYLVQKASRAQLELAQLTRAQADPAADAGAGDTPAFVDTTRTVIPLARPSMAFRMYRSAHSTSHAMVTASKIALACIAASVVSIALKLDRPDWAVVSVFLTLQWGPNFIPGTVRGIHRMLGSIIGICLYVGFFLLEPNALLLLVALMCTQFAAEIFVVKNYAITVIFTTPLALLMGGQTSDAGAVAMSRLGETAIAFVFALLTLWLFRPNAQVAEHEHITARSFTAMGNLIGSLATNTPAESLEQRRDLQYELLAERRMLQAISADHPDVAAAAEPEHLAVQAAGYHLLDYCTANPDRELSLAEIEGLATQVRAAAKG